MFERLTGWTQIRASQTAYALNFCETRWQTPFEVQHCVASILDANEHGPVRFTVPADAKIASMQH